MDDMGWRALVHNTRLVEFLWRSEDIPLEVLASFHDFMKVRGYHTLITCRHAGWRQRRT